MLNPRILLQLICLGTLDHVLFFPCCPHFLFFSIEGFYLDIQPHCKYGILKLQFLPVPHMPAQKILTFFFVSVCVTRNYLCSSCLDSFHDLISSLLQATWFKLLPPDKFPLSWEKSKSSWIQLHTIVPVFFTRINCEILIFQICLIQCWKLTWHWINNGWSLLLHEYSTREETVR